jgi:two-component system sensor histidine kinase KdpD
LSNFAKTSQRYLAAAAIIVASTGVAELLYRVTETTRLSMVFLGGVLVTAYLLGSGPAYFAAGLAFLIYDFYLAEPRFTIQFGPEDLLALAMFLAVAMLTGNLTGRIRDEAKRAEARARSTAALFDATRAFSASSDEAFIREQLVQHLGAAAKGEAFVRNGLRVFASPPDFPMPPDLLREAMSIDKEARAGRLATSTAAGWSLRPLLAHGEFLGVAAWRTTPAQPPGPDERLLEILADVGAAAIARARLAAGKAEAEARARTEDLRNALLSSVSHDLRTPLAAIMASASSLSEFGESFDAATRKDLSATIQQETERLDTFVANLLSMTRLEAGALTVQRVAFSVPEVIERTVRRRMTNSSRKVTITIAPDVPEVLGDPVLFEQALGNVFENALRYTSEDQGIILTVTRGDAGVSVEVQDEGRGIPPGDIHRIFEKFFRSSATAHKPGTGLGLSITKGLVEGMGGSVLARLHGGDGSGLIVAIKLPVAA